MILTIVNQHQHLYSKLLHLTTNTTTTTTTTSTITMLPSLPLVTPTPSKLPAFPPVLIVAKPTLSSTHMTPPTRVDMSNPNNQCRRLLPQHTTSTTTTISTTTMPIPHRLQPDFSLPGNFL